MRRRLAILAVAAAIFAVPSGGLGCFDHQCEGDRVGPYGEAQAEGDFIEQGAWESTPPLAKWLNFAAGRTWTFHIPSWERAGREVLSVAAYVSAADTPNAPPRDGQYDNFTEASGNLAEVTRLGPGRFEIKNNTCTQLYLRLVVRAGPPRDAGADSAANDAQTE